MVLLILNITYVFLMPVLYVQSLSLLLCHERHLRASWMGFSANMQHSLHYIWKSLRIRFLRICTDGVP